MIWLIYLTLLNLYCPVILLHCVCYGLECWSNTWHIVWDREPKHDLSKSWEHMDFY